MRNRIQGKQLNRTSSHRAAMLRNMAAGLFEHGSIETTMPKAKAVQPFVEKIITLAKQGTFNARRQIESRLNDRKIHSWVADPNVPDSRKENPYFDLPDEGDISFNRYGEVKKAPRLVQHIMSVVGPRFSDRDGGYTRIIRTGRHRFGDGADIVVLQFVGAEEGSEAGGNGTSGRRRQADRRQAFAASLGVEVTPEAEEPAAPAEEAAPEEAVAEAPAADEAPVEEAASEETAAEEPAAEETPVEEEAPAAEEASAEEEAPAADDEAPAQEEASASEDEGDEDSKG